MKLMTSALIASKRDQSSRAEAGFRNKIKYFLKQLYQMMMAHNKRFSSGLNKWSIGCLGLYGPLREYFSLYRAVSQREGERREK